MIIILNRNDLLPDHRNHSIEDLKLDHSGLSNELIQQADLVVFVEGSDIKFLHSPGIQSKDRFDVFMRYIRSSAPTKPVRAKRYPRRIKKEWTLAGLESRIFRTSLDLKKINTARS